METAAEILGKKVTVAEVIVVSRCPRILMELEVKSERFLGKSGQRISFVDRENLQAVDLTCLHRVISFDVSGERDELTELKVDDEILRLEAAKSKAGFAFFYVGPSSDFSEILREMVAHLKSVTMS